MGIFKSYDIRGIYPDQISPEFAQQLGYAFGQHIKKQRGKQAIVVGRDARAGSDVLQDNFVLGALAANVPVSLLGICTTPSLYYVTAYHKFSAGVMITASHNPRQYNGFKFCLKGAAPFGYVDGLQEIEKKLVENIPSPSSSPSLGIEMMEHYIQMLIDTFKAIDFSKVHIIVDPGNGVGALSCLPVFQALKIPHMPINAEVNGEFPDRSPNPTEKDALKKLQQKVKETKADLGIAFDGDADRLVVVDPQGIILSSSQTAELIGHHYLASYKDPTFVLDIRLSKSAREDLYEKGGEIVLSKVGHVHIKKLMKARKAIFGAEFSGHFMHANEYNIDDALYSALLLIQQCAEGVRIRAKEKYHLLTKDITVASTGEAINTLQKKYSDARMMFLDGISIEYTEWWCNVRPSNTEPLLRITLEALTEAIAIKKLEEIIAVLAKNI